MRRPLSTLLVAVLLAACGGGVATPEVASGGVEPAGEEPAFGGQASVPQFEVGEAYPAMPSTLGGTTHLAADGCWHLTMQDGEALIAFPTGAELGDDGDAVDLPGGASVPAGAVVVGEATLIPAEQLRGGPNGFWDHVIGRCGAAQVVAFEDLAVLVGDPAAVELTEHHPCGFGFTAASADQTAALLVSATTGAGPGGAPEGGSITLPAPDWSATLRAGADLMAGWCDDVQEPGEPTPVWYAEWPVTAGSLQFTPPEGAGCAGAPVTAVLRDLVVVTTDGEEVRLPELSITNTAWGCFAG